MNQPFKTSNSVLSVQGLSPNVCVLSTTRYGGVSQSPFESLNLGMHVGDDPQAVQENRDRLIKLLPAEPLWLDQVHGCDVVDADVSCTDVPQADAAVTTQPQRVLAIMTADCLPVVLYSEKHSVLGMAHAGWRGLAQGVLRAVVDEMVAKGCPVDAISAWIGPCIGPSAYQVDASVRDAFLNLSATFADCFVEDVSASEKWVANLPKISIKQLYDLGVKQAVWSGYCTVQDEAKRFYSYRKEGQTGRMATLAWITNP